MYDYVIVGAGSAGCLLAARLSEAPHLNVLLIEAGPPARAPAIRIPLGFPALFRTALDWNYWTEPQPTLEGRRLFWPRGRVLGGSGSINAMVHLNPCDTDLAKWVEQGATGWSARDLRELFEAFEHPPLDAKVLPQPNRLSLAFLDAAEEFGLPRVPALRDASDPAAGLFRVNVRNGVRRSSAVAFLNPALRRGNLTVWTGIPVTRLIVEQGYATGIEYRRSGSLHHVAATNEVILCAGAIGSPELLLRSGVGPPSHLQEVGIPVTAPLDGVGGNLQDHLAAPLSHYSTKPVSLSGSWNWLRRIQHLLRRAGPLASNGAEAGAFLKSRPVLPECDLELLFAPVHYVDHGFASPGGHGFALIPVLLAPHSRGTVRLASGDPAEPPLIDPQYLSDPADFPRLREGVCQARALLKKEPLAGYTGEPVQGRLLEPDELIRTWAQTLYHPVGTCRMGSGEDAVVDAELKVRGVAGLRIADASVMPVIPRAHTNATTLAIAQKAARLILQRHAG